MKKVVGIVVILVVEILVLSHTAFDTLKPCNRAVSDTKRQLQAQLDQLDFRPFATQVQNRLPKDLIEQYQTVLEPVIVEPPGKAVPYPWPVPDPVQVDCKAERFAEILTGTPRLEPIRIVDLIPFAYEVDVLEMRLFELNATVDRFVVIEATYTHRFARKPLFLAKHWKRFEPFHSKLTYLVLDDAFVLSHIKEHSPTHRNGDDWRIEDINRQVLWQRYLDVFGLPSDPDQVWIMHSDADEMLSRITLEHLKHCQTKSASSLSLPLTFYRFNFGWVVPDLSHPVLSLRTVTDIQQHGFGRRTKEPSWPNGCFGMDLNRFGPIQMQLYKLLSVAEGGQVPRGDLRILTDLTYAESFMAKGERLCCAHPVHLRTTDFRPECRFLPWIVATLPDRYPAFVGTGFSKDLFMY